jgi:hypothetical protein
MSGSSDACVVEPRVESINRPLPVSWQFNTFYPSGRGYYDEEGAHIPSSCYFQFDNLRLLPYNSLHPTTYRESARQFRRHTLQKNALHSA